MPLRQKKRIVHLEVPVTELPRMLDVLNPAHARQAQFVLFARLSHPLADVAIYLFSLLYRLLLANIANHQPVHIVR